MTKKSIILASLFSLFVSISLVNKADDFFFLHLGPRAAEAADEFANANSFLFDHNNSEYLSMSNTDFGSYDRQQFCISVWFKTSGNGFNKQGIVAKYGFSGTREFFLQMDDSERIDFRCTDSSGTTLGRLIGSDTTLDDNVWHHLLVVWDSNNGTAGDRMRMYVDGTEVTSFDTDTNPSSGASVGSTTRDIEIGTWGGGNFNTDNLDEVAFFSGSIPSVTDLRDSGTGKPKDLTGLTGLKSWARADNGITADEILSASWTDNNTVTQDTSVP